MRIKIILVLLSTSFFAFGQKETSLFQLKCLKESAQGHMPFYDEEEIDIHALLSFKGQIDYEKHKLHWAIQPKGTASNRPDIYVGYYDSIVLPQFVAIIPINDTFIKSGNYSLSFRLINQEEQIVEVRHFDFQTLRKENNFYKQVSIQNETDYARTENIDLEKTFVAKYPKEQLQKNILALNPICDKTEVRIIYDLINDTNIEYAQRFFLNFWKKRNPLHPEDEWKAYAEKLNFVAKQYGSSSYPGYQSDRGKLYLKYGPPNRKINASNERGTRPYEVWFYTELENFTNLSILFVQVGKLANERIIVHSTSPAFFNNPNWPSLLFVSEDEIQNKISHRVYEFFK